MMQLASYYFKEAIVADIQCALGITPLCTACNNKHTKNGSFFELAMHDYYSLLSASKNGSFFEVAMLISYSLLSLVVCCMSKL